MTSTIDTQVLVFVLITCAIAFATFLKCRSSKHVATTNSTSGNKEVFLAGGGLSWVFVAGSITLTNLSTDQLVGMNGSQMILLAWWEFAAVLGLVILAKVFLPYYYRYNCTTTTELLEKRYGNQSIRTIVSVLFLLGNIFIYLPVMLYGGSLFLQTMFDVPISLMTLAISLALLGSAYAVFGGLRAVAISDTYSGVLLFGLGLFVVYLALAAINFDFSGIPKERLTMIGDSTSPIPWHTLLTGMIFIQMFYWSTNQTITQRAMASPTLREGQKGVFVAAGIRLLLVPPMIVIPGVVSYKLYGSLGDAAYGQLVGDLLPGWLSGAFAAAITAAVLTSFNSVLNSSTTLYICDIHEKYVDSNANVPRLNAVITIVFVVIASALVPLYSTASSLIEILQKLNGLLSMPILSAFLIGIFAKNVDARASIVAVVFGVLEYAIFTFFWGPLHFIHLMFITLLSCVLVTILVNRIVFKKRIQLDFIKQTARV